MDYPRSHTEPTVGLPDEVYTVSRLNREARAVLEAGFPALIWIEGELSNLAQPSSGHIYFSIKDANAQVRCAMFRQHNLRMQFRPKDGMQVLARARIGLYEGRGEFQLIIEHMEPYGEGALRLAFEQLKQRLGAEGLFDTAYKRPIPAYPKCVGVVTSPTGAAIRDVLSVLARRFPALPVVVYPVPVQGAGAGQQIARMLQLAGGRGDCDVLILTRGGGSLEDLWAFNEEVVARAIRACPLPVVVGVGHEIDVTIADFVADQRAATPSAAAELVSPDQSAWQAAVVALRARLVRRLATQLANLNQGLAWLEKRLAQHHPERRLAQQGQRLDELDQRLVRAQRSRLRDESTRLAALRATLFRHTPQHRLRQRQLAVAQLAQRQRAAIQMCMARQQHRLSTLGRALDGVSPLATLGRGYALVTRVADGALVRSASAVQTGDAVEARLAQGRLICVVNQSLKR